MTKSELLELLASYPDDTLIVIGVNPEITRAFEVSTCCSGSYIPRNVFSGELMAEGDEPEGAKYKSAFVICLYS